jgi:hypothetical protein
VGGEFGGAAGVQVIISLANWRTPSFFLKVVRPLIIVDVVIFVNYHLFVIIIMCSTIPLVKQKLLKFDSG